MSTKPLLIVKWMDHAAEGGWADVSKFHAPAICYSVGWLYMEDKKGITLVSNYSPSEDHKSHQTGNLQYILKGCVLERKIIRKAIK